MFRIKYNGLAPRLLCGSALATVLACGAAAQSQGQAQKASLNIPAGPLDVALNTVSVETDSEILFAKPLVSGRQAPPLKGVYAPGEALAALLVGTNLQVQQNSDHVYLIKPAASVRIAQAAPRRPATAASPPANVETVVVTAEKRKEDIQQVPISVTALTQQQLTERQIAAGPDLIRDVPNMNFGKTNFSGYSIELRGIGTQAISVTTDPAVAVAFNGTPFLRNHFFEQEFFDLDNVEVLRGPQGTLYGRNATAGVVNLIPALPSDHFEAMASADIGNYSNRRLEGMINLPIVGDKLDIRVAGEWTKRDGYTDDTTLNTSVDGRDLWSGRVTIGFKPTPDLQTYLVWEHFQEDDDRLRSGKQLCATANPPTSVGGVPVPGLGSDTSYGGAYDPITYLSQGCQAASLYSPNSFEVPYGGALPYVHAAELVGAINDAVNPYAEATQSSNLRQIESVILPHYRAKNDILEFNAEYKLSPALTLTSQTGWNSDFLFSTEDYNRFNTSPGIFAYHVPGSDQDVNLQGQISPTGYFCDPQVGCANRLVGEDLSDENSWQFSQEFRLASNFSGPFNFNVGANYLHYVTEENYYVFINALTLYTLGSSGGGVESQPWVPGVSDNSGCLYALGYGYQPLNPKTHGSSPSQSQCNYIDPNPIGSLNNMGHNYFLSQNPYELSSYAVFGEAYYNILSNLKLTTGLRFTDDQKSFTDIPSEVLTDGWGYFSTGQVNQGWDRLTGRAVLDWTPSLPFTDQSLIYASYGHGYKAGGANPPGAALLAGGAGSVIFPDHPLTFKPEYIEAFELGTKNTLLDGTLTLNGDVFYYNYTGYQISEIVDRTAINNNYNAHVEGAEIETNWEPLPGLKFNFAGGWEETAAASGDAGVDLIDRTAGNPNWIVVKPHPTQASNCILPTYVVAALLTQANTYGSNGDQLVTIACGMAYGQNLDPLTGLPYVPNPTQVAPHSNNSGMPPPAGYPGFNPATAPNNGEGFSKNLSRHQLPNAPPFTLSFGSQYTVPVAQDWAATVRGDFYWQADSWARIFNDNPYDRLHGYTNLNLALILSSDDGWQVMGYIKNVFNTTAITGDFLNSDDSGLTTNVFLTDPRLYGIRVTKDFGAGDTGAMADVENWIAGFFSDAGKTKPTLWVTYGGDAAQLSGQGDVFTPPFVVNNLNSTAYQPTSIQDIEKPQLFALDQEAKITFQPTDSDFEFVASIRYGRTSRARNVTEETIKTHPAVHASVGFQSSIPYLGTHIGLNPITNFSTTQSRRSETHSIVDFEAGKDLGLGLFGAGDTNTVDVGIRVAQFVSKFSTTIHARPDSALHTQPNTFASFFFPSKHFNNYYSHFHTYAAQARAKRSFQGVGPKISWKNSLPLIKGSNEEGLSFDWGANGALLFGRRKAHGEHHESGHYHYRYPANSHYYSNTTVISRSKKVLVPNVGAFAGVTFNYLNAKVSLGYRADLFLHAMDTGWDKEKGATTSLLGPYANLSIGF